MSKFYKIFIFQLIILTGGIVYFPELQAQQTVGIGTSNPNPNAILDIKSDKQGLLVPRLNSTQRNQLGQILQASSGNEGMIVFDTDKGKFYYWFGAEWKEGLGAITSSEVQGDLNGNLPSPLVIGLQGRAVSNASPATNQVLKWNGTSWAPSADIGKDYTAGAGIQINNGQVINTGDPEADDDVLITDNAGGDLSGTFGNLVLKDNTVTNSKIGNSVITHEKISINAITTEKISDQAITLSKINPGSPNTFLAVAVDGTIQWENKDGVLDSQLEEGKILIGNSSGEAEERTISGDISILSSGEVIIEENTINSSKILNGSVSTADIANDAITREKLASDVAGAGLNQEVDGSLSINAGTGLTVTGDILNLSNTGVTTGGYGQKDKVAQFTVDEQGRIVAVTEVDIEASPTGLAGGDLNGNYPNPTIKDGVITQAKIANDAVGLPQIKNDDPNTILITDPSGNPRWFEPFANQVIITGNDGRISSESRSSFATPTLPPGNVFVGSSGGVATPLAANTNGHILIGNGSGLSSVDISGDIDVGITGISTIQPGVVNNGKLANDAVTSAKILDGTIATSDLADGSVTNAKVGADAVTSDKISDGTIVNADLAASSINSSNIVDGTIANADLADGSVTTQKILDNTIADGDLNKTAIPLSGFGAAAADVDLGANALINVEDPINAQDAATKNYVDGQITTSTTLAEGHVYVGDNTDQASAVNASTSGNILVGDGTTINSVAVGGDVTLAADGTATIADGAVTSAKILDGTVATSDLADGSVTNAKVGADAITSDKIDDGTIVNADMAASSINSSNIVDGTIMNADLADGSVTTQKILDNSIADGDLNKTAIPLSGFGAAAADVDLGANALINVEDPTNAQDAATKNYVDGQITTSTTLAEGHVYVGDNTDQASAVHGSTAGNILVGDGTTVNSVAVGGDVTLAADGTATIADGAVTSTKILDGTIATSDLADGSVTNSKVGADAITSDKISDGTIVNADLAASSVNSSNIVDGTIVNADLADGSVTTQKILDNTIADGDLNKTAIPLSGFGAAAADLDLGANALINVEDPINAQDAATKNYVDGQITTSTTLAEGHVYVGDNTDQASAVNASTSGNILVGDGTTINSVAVGGDVTLAADGTATIANGAVTSAKIMDGTIATIDLADGSVTNAKIGADAITSDKIDDGTIVNADLADGSVTTQKILDGTIADGDLNKTAIPLSGFGAAAADVDLGANALINVEDPTNAQDAATKNYVDGQITTSTTLAEGHVYVGDNTDQASAVNASTSGNILVGDGTTINSVAVGGDVTLAADGTATIANGAVTSAKIMDGTIATSDLADGSVTNAKIGADAITSDKIDDGTIVNADLADGSVTTQKILDGTIADGDLNKTAIPLSGFGAAAADVDLGANALINVEDPTNAQDAATKNYVDGQITTSTTLAEGHVYVGDNTDQASAVHGSTAGNILVGDGTTVNSVAVGGDVTLAADGTATIADGAVTSTKILDGTIATSDLADGSVTNSKVGADAITSDKISDGTIVNADLAASSVNSSNIVDGTIVNADLADGSVTTQKILDGTIADGDLNKTAIPLSGFGAAAADVDLGANALINVEDPTNAQDAATKNYVDGQITTSTTLAEGHVYVGDNTDQASAVNGSTSGNILVGDGTTVNSVAVGGDVTLAADGTATIADGAVTSTKILDGTIATSDLADGGVTNAKVGANAITTDKISDGTIVNADLADGSVTTQKILDGTIADADLNKTAIPLSGFGAAAADVDLGANALINVEDPTNAQDAATKNYVDGQITTSTTLAEGHVYVGDNTDQASAVHGSTAGNILVGDGTTVNSVAVGGDVTLAADGTATIADGAVTSTKILDGTIATSDLADGSVTNSKVGADAITSDKISDGTIVNADLADGSVTTQKILDGTIADGDLNKTAIPLSGFGAAAADVDLGANALINVEDPINAQDAATKNYVDGQITTSTTLAEGHVYVGDNTDQASAVNASTSGNILVGDGTTINSVAVGGDVTLAADGTATIANGAVTSAKIMDGTIATIDLADGSVTNAKVGADAITSNKISNGTIVNADLAASSVTSSNIVNGTIINADLASGAVTTDKILDNTITNNDIANSTINFEKITQSGANNGQVMVWSNPLGKWTPGNATSIFGGTSGDITAVVTNNGSGLQGGSESGNASLSLVNSGSGEILIGNGTNVNPTTVSGDVVLSSTGVATLTTDAIQNANIEDNAVSTSKIQDGAITASKIAQNAATGGQVLKWNSTAWIALDDNVNDADADPANEIQSLSISGNTISLSGSDPITISSSIPTEDQVLTYKSGSWKAESSTIVRTGYYAVDPLDFKGTGQDGTQKIFYYNETSEASFVSSEDISGIAAPIHLPHGAVIVSVTFYFRDEHLTEDMNFEVNRKERAGGTTEVVASYSSTGLPGDTSASSASILNGTIDNSLYTYRVIVELEPDSYGNTMQHRVYSIVIEYTETLN